MKNILNFLRKLFNLETLENPAFMLSILIILIIYFFLYVINIKGTLIIIIFVVSFLPLILEINEIYTNPEKPYYKKEANKNYWKLTFFLKYKYIFLLVVILIFSLSPIYLPSILLTQMNDYSNSQNYQAELNDLTKKIVLNATTDYEKMQALYDWSNIYSKNIIGIYSKKPLIQIYPMHVYLTEPYYCVRLKEHENPEWVTKSRCGACEEFSLFYMILAENANLTVRSGAYFKTPLTSFSSIA